MYKHCLTNISNFACQTCMLVRLATQQTLLDKHMLLVKFQKHLLLVTRKNVYQARVGVMAKLTNIVLDKLNSKRLPNNACSLAGASISSYRHKIPNIES